MRASIKDIEMQKYFIMKKKLKKQKLTWKAPGKF
jgi:hypothetical protein